MTAPDKVWPGPVGRVALVSAALLSLGLSSYASGADIARRDCLQEHAERDAVRTRAIADATDVERRADLALIEGGPTTDDERAAAVEARRNTDRVRAANPPPAAADAVCK